MLGGSQKKPNTFGKREGLTPLVPRPAKECNGSPENPPAASVDRDPSDVFATSDAGLAQFLAPQDKQPSQQGLQRTSGSRNSDTAELFARSSLERAELFVQISEMLKAFEEHWEKDQETFRKLSPMADKARSLQAGLLSQNYALEDLKRMTTHFDVILKNFAGIQNFAKTVFSAHERQPSATSITLLEALCGEQSQRHLLQGRKNRSDFLLIEKAHEALGHAPDSHPLTKMAALENEKFKAELDRILAQSDQILLPYVRLVIDTTDGDLADRGKKQSDKALLLEDLQEQSPSEKGTAFLSAVELSRMASNSQLAKDGPQLGLDNVRYAKALAYLPASMKSLAFTLCKKKLVFTTDAALDLLRLCAVEKLDLGQEYKSLPAQFWNSLGNSLPKNSIAVQQILTSAVSLKKKHKKILLVMTGLTNEEALRDEVADSYRKTLEDSQQALSSLLDNFSQHTTRPDAKTGILGRLFGTAQSTMTEDGWRPSWGVITSLDRLAEALPPAFYFDRDTSAGVDLLMQLKDRTLGVLKRHGQRSDLETAVEAHELALSIDFASPARAAAENLAVILPLEQVIAGFQQLSAFERAALSAFSLSLHPLPKSGKPSAKWLDAVATSDCDDILDKLLTNIGPISSKDDDIIVAAVLAAARMPGVSTQTLAQLVESGFEDAPHGKRHERLANASLWVLSQRRGDASVAAMRHIAETCRWITGRDLAAKYLKNMVRGDTDNPVLAAELLLPGLKIWPEPYREPIADGHAVFSYNAPDRLSLTWENPDGAISTNPTPDMKTTDSAGVKRLKKLVPQLERTLMAHIRWLERLFLSDSSLRFDEWQERYLDHETRGALAQNLIWRAETEGGEPFSFIPSQGRFHDAAGNTIDVSGCQISLWHPADDPASVDAWQAYLVEQALVQPFAQAFRSSYAALAFDDAIEALRTTRIEHRWHRSMASLIEGYGWVSSKKFKDHDEAPLKLHLFDPVSRFYLAVTLTRNSELAGTSRWFELREVQLSRGDLGATPTKAGLKKARPLEPSDLTTVQRSEVIRSLYGLLSESYMDASNPRPRLFGRGGPFPEAPFVRPMSEERAHAIQAYAPLLVDPRAARNWLGEAEGEDRISVQDNGRLSVNGVKERYIFCPFENRLWSADDLVEWNCNIVDSQIEGASNVPFGLDTLMRRMAATVQLLTKDDRPGNSRLSKGRYY
ncbi:DUF4132 domain-containing protein [uncultured Roseibium sp.]|uniref:DUF4132 domain-containing protein n=1 Tax=uncultured Roseibium sp. TaxID=1936171 RepID=UPI0026275EE7|nr:DUF4132 domain-containing protein [uncultured Roseibium sp.]